MNKFILALTWMTFMTSNALATTLSITSYLETALPMENAQVSKDFYMSLGYEVVNEQPWGMITLKREDSRLTLLSKAFFKKMALAYTTADIQKVKKELAQNSVELIEDDSESIPPRIVINDPTGNEIIIYQVD